MANIGELRRLKEELLAAARLKAAGVVDEAVMVQPRPPPKSPMRSPARQSVGGMSPLRTSTPRVATVLSQLDRALTPGRSTGDRAGVATAVDVPTPSSPLRPQAAEEGEPDLPAASQSPEPSVGAGLRGSVVSELLRSAAEEDLDAYSHRALHALYSHTVRDIGRISTSIDGGFYAAALEAGEVSEESRSPGDIALPVPPLPDAEPTAAPPPPVPLSSFSPIKRTGKPSASDGLRGSVVSELLRSAAEEDLDAYSHRALHVS